MGGGALSGAWFGLFIGTIFALFDPGGFNVLSVVATMRSGAVFGVIWTAVVYRFTSGGARDFTSVSLVVAAKYEVLCEHKHAQRGAGCSTRWTRCAPLRSRSGGPARPSRPASRSNRSNHGLRPAEHARGPGARSAH